jgi:hypothetical protein
MLVLPMGVTYKVHCSDGLRRHDKPIKYLSNITVTTATIVGTTDRRDFLKQAVEMILSRVLGVYDYLTGFWIGRLYLLHLYIQLVNCK